MSKTVVAVGGSTLTPVGSGWGTKLPIRDYLVDLASHVGRLEYVAPVNPWPFECAEIPQGIPVHPMARGRLGRLSFALTVLAKARRSVALLLHYPTCLVLDPILPLVRARAGRVVSYISNDYVRDAESAASAWKRRWYVRAYERAIRGSDAVIVRGRMLADRARPLNARVYETVPIAQIGRPQGSAPAPIRQADPGRFRVLFIGRLLRGKGLQTLLDALTGLQPGAGEAVHLDIVGDGPDAEAIRAAIEVAGLAGRCRMHGYISDAGRLATIWGAADVLVMPSTSPEGVPRVIEEAFAWDVPVISTTVGGIDAEFRTGGEVMLVPPGAVDAMRQALERMIREPGLREELRRRGRERMERWRRLGSAGAQHARILAGTEPIQ